MPTSLDGRRRSPRLGRPGTSAAPGQRSTCGSGRSRATVVAWQGEPAGESETPAGCGVGRWLAGGRVQRCWAVRFRAALPTSCGFGSGSGSGSGDRRVDQLLRRRPVRLVGPSGLRRRRGSRDGGGRDVADELLGRHQVLLELRDVLVRPVSATLMGTGCPAVVHGRAGRSAPRVMRRKLRGEAVVSRRHRSSYGSSSGRLGGRPSPEERPVRRRPIHGSRCCRANRASAARRVVQPGGSEAGGGSCHSGSSGG